MSSPDPHYHRQIDFSQLGTNELALTELKFGRSAGLSGSRFLLLAEALRTNTIVINLELNNCNLENHDLFALSAALTSNTILQALILDSNRNLTIHGISALMVAVKESELKLLSLSKLQQMDSMGIQAVMRNLPTTLTTLKLDNVGICGGAVDYLAEGLKSNSSLTELSLENNVINYKRCQYLCEVLFHNTTLLSLNLKCNYLNQMCSKAIGELLKANSTLKVLNLDNNTLTYGMDYIIEGLKENQVLRHVSLSHCHLGALGAKHGQNLVEMMNVNYNLISIPLLSNKFTPAIKKAIEELVGRNLNNVRLKRDSLFVMLLKTEVLGFVPEEIDYRYY